MKLFKHTVSFLFLLSLASCNSLFYMPTDILYTTPEYFGYKREDITFRTDDGLKLQAWYIRAAPKNGRKNRNTIVLQFHGNGQNMTAHFLSLLWIVDKGYDLIVFDYRGYGDSQGSPDREKIHKDAIAVLDQSLEFASKNGKKLIVHGQSLGGAIALRAIPEMKHPEALRLIIADSTFYSYGEIARAEMTGILYPFRLISYLTISDKFSPSEALDRLPAGVPLLVIHDRMDPIVPFSQGKKIFDKAREPKFFLEVSGGQHVGWPNMGNSYYTRDYIKYLDRFSD